MTSLMDEYPMPGMEIDPRELEKAKYLALMRMGLGMAGKEPLGRAVQGGINTYFAGDEAARRNADQKMQEMRAKMQYAMGMKKAEEEKTLQAQTSAIANDVTIDEVQKYSKLAILAAANNRPADAKIYADIFDKQRVKYNSKSETMKTPDGKLVVVQLSDTGEVKLLPFQPAEKLHFANTQTQAGIGLNPFTGAQESAGIEQGVSPSDQQRIALDRARLGMEQQRLAQGRLGQIMETSEGLVRVNDKNVAVPIKTEGGAAIGPKPSAAVIQKLAENNVAIQGIDDALRLTEAYPKAFGMKNYAGDAVMQRTDPKGVSARAAVGIVGSTKIHDLSGAAVSAAESPRLQPHIPTSTDEPGTVKKKLTRMKRELVLMQNELSQGKMLREVINAPSIPEETQSKITGLTKTGYETIQQNYNALAAKLKKDDEERARLGR